MPDPNGDGKGSPTSNVANILETAGGAAAEGADRGSEAGIIIVSGHDALTAAAESANQGSEHGIIIVSGHDALTATAGSFWDQAAGATQGDTSVSVIATTAVSQAEIAGLNQVSTATETTTTHDFSSAFDTSAHSAALESTVAHDAGFASASFTHSELGSLALHTVSFNVGGFATQMHI
jgi:hypothetical protein